MSRTVWKYELKHISTVINMPKGSKLLTVGSQTVAGRIEQDRIMLWVEVDPNETELEPRVFYVAGTGWPKPESDMEFEVDYRGTAFLYRSNLVYHIYEEVIA